MKSICIIIPYFGELPAIFPFWLQSAFRNPTIDFLFFTDGPIVEEKNIRVYKTTFQEFRTRIQKKFDFPISLSSPYKICDYRGAYGFIFEEEIRSYDFWGFGDIDLIYGNIRSFLTDEILSNHKVLLGFGHLTIYRNNAECNRFFMSAVPGCLFYKDVFTHPRACLFDEFLHGGLSDMWQRTDPDHFWTEKPFDDVLIPLRALNFVSVSRQGNPVIFEYSENQLYRIYSEQGKIVKQPTLYAHFQMRKFMKINTACYEKYLIVPNKLIDHDEVTSNKIKYWTNSFEINSWVWLLTYKFRKRLQPKAYALKQNAYSRLADIAPPKKLI